MSNINVFISAGRTATDEHEKFITAIEKRIRSENLIPNTVGRNKFSAEAPLKTVIKLMNDCSGTIIIALERTFFPTGIEWRNGTKEQQLTNVKYTTSWNQIEAAMAYTKGQPILVIIEEGIKNEGLLEKGNDWYVMTVKPDISALTTDEFNGVLSDWKQKVESFNSNKNLQKLVDTSSLTIGDLIKGLKPAQLWGIITVLIGLIVGSISAGQYISKIVSPPSEKVLQVIKPQNSPEIQKHIDEIASLETTKIGDYTYQEIIKLLNDVDDNYSGRVSFIDYRDSLSSSEGTRLTWHDSNNYQMEVFQPQFKNKLIGLNLIQLKGNGHFVLTEMGKQFFIVDDKIKVHTYMQWDIRNQVIRDSLDKKDKNLSN